MNIKVFKTIVQIVGIIGLIAFLLLFLLKKISIHEFIWPLIIFMFAVAILYNVDKLKKLGIGNIIYETRKEIDQIRNESMEVSQKLDKLQQTIEALNKQMEAEGYVLKAEPGEYNIIVQETVKIGETIKANVQRTQSSISRVEDLVNKAEKQLSGKAEAKSSASGDLTVTRKKKK